MIHVTSVKALNIGFPGPISIPLNIFIAATGIVPTSGWTNPRLLPRVGSKVQPELWEFDMVADQPSGIVLDVELPIAASFIGFAPPEAKVVRVHGSKNEFVDADLIGDASRKLVAGLADFAANIIYQREIARYEDSIQPTGTLIWKNDGPFGAPMPHAEMKKLEHKLTLKVEGPNNDKVDSCVNEAATAAVLTGLVVGFTTGGMAGVSAAGAAFTESIERCLGESFSVTLYDNSHWVYWTT